MDTTYLVLISLILAFHHVWAAHHNKVYQLVYGAGLQTAILLYALITLFTVVV